MSEHTPWSAMDVLFAKCIRCRGHLPWRRRYNTREVLMATCCAKVYTCRVYRFKTFLIEACDIDMSNIRLIKKVV